MPESFSNILVPVDFTLNTEVAIRKAVELGDESSTIHLLHVQKAPGIFSVFPACVLARAASLYASKDAAKAGLLQLERQVREMSPGTRIKLKLVSGRPLRQALLRQAKKTGADLVVLGRSSCISWWPLLHTSLAHELASEAGCAVLTVKPGALNNRIRTVVVPISGQVPMNKMKALKALCRKGRLNIHLVAFAQEDEAPLSATSSSLLNVYQWLKTSIRCPVEYAVLKGENKARALLRYAAKTDADILLVHPKTETRINWLNRHIADVLPPASGVQVMAVGA